jgi:hypothetical protein
MNAWGVPSIADEQWRAIDPLAFKEFMAVCDMGQHMVATIIPHMPPTTKVVTTKVELELNSTFDRVAVNEMDEVPSASSFSMSLLSFLKRLMT